MKWVFLNIVPIICVCAAAYGMAHHASGWGWFLLVAVLTFLVPAKK